MKKILNLSSRPKNRRNVVIDTIRHHLYPEEEYPLNLFPDLPMVLLNCFMKEIRSRQEFLEVYQSPPNDNAVEKLARDILVFKNLLENHPQTVVLMYRTSIKKFIRYKHTNPEEWEDIFQEIMTRLIADKIYRIREKFDFTFTYKNFIRRSFFTSYFMVSVRNIYMDIIRELKVRPLTAGQIQSLDNMDVLQEDFYYEEKNMLHHLVIDEEFRKLDTVLALYFDTRPKLSLCLKLKSRVPVTENEVKQCFPACTREDISALKQDFKEMKDKKLFDKVAPVFNRNEGRENKSDTIRKWVSVKMDEIIGHLNRTHKTTVYTGKNFVDFLNLYYERITPETPGNGEHDTDTDNRK